jgi:hypothetical protein
MALGNLPQNIYNVINGLRGNKMEYLRIGLLIALINGPALASASHAANEPAPPHIHYRSKGNGALGATKTARLYGIIIPLAEATKLAESYNNQPPSQTLLITNSIDKRALLFFVFPDGNSVVGRFDAPKSSEGTGTMHVFNNPDYGHQMASVFLKKLAAGAALADAEPLFSRAFDLMATHTPLPQAEPPVETSAQIVYSGVAASVPTSGTSGGFGHKPQLTPPSFSK